jgi:hypothetical protein
MATATRATPLTPDGTPLIPGDRHMPAKVQVEDDGGGSTVYAVRYDRPTRGSVGEVELVWDSFHPEGVRLETKNGEELLRQEGPGLPSECVILVNRNQGMTGHGSPASGDYSPAPGIPVVGGWESSYEYHVCEKDG